MQVSVAVRPPEHIRDAVTGIAARVPGHGSSSSSRTRERSGCG